MRHWNVCIAKDTSKTMLGLHGLHNAFRGLQGVEVAALYDTNAANASAMMRFLEARRHYTDYSEMLDQEKPDIVVITSRHPGDHLPQIEAAATRGIHIYCEKPMAVSLEDADRIIELADRHRIKICMAHPARYALEFRVMKAMIEDGAIGTPLRVYGRGKCDHRGGGEDLIVLGTHILDLQTCFFGSPEAVMAEILQNGKPIIQTDRIDTVEPLGPVAGDEVFASFRFSNGVHGTFESRRGLFDSKQNVVHMGIAVTGTTGALSMRFNDNVPVESRLRISRIPAPPEDCTAYEDVALNETRTVPGAEPLDYSLCGSPDIPNKRFFLEANRFAAWDLMQAIAEDRLPESNQHNARIVQEMIQGIYASHLSGKRVSFPLDNRRHPLEG